MRCEDLNDQLAGVIDGSAVLDRRTSRHVESCLRCQAELAQYRRLLRSLRQLRDEPVSVPRDLSALIAARLDGTAPTSPWTRRVAYAGALAATAAGAAGAIALLSTRNRRLRLAS
jgi:anti-sigma factor RsiW